MSGNFFVYVLTSFARQPNKLRGFAFRNIRRCAKDAWGFYELRLLISFNNCAVFNSLFSGTKNLFRNVRSVAAGALRVRTRHLVCEERFLVYVRINEKNKTFPTLNSPVANEIFLKPWAVLCAFHGRNKSARYHAESERCEHSFNFTRDGKWKASLLKCNFERKKEENQFHFVNEKRETFLMNAICDSSLFLALLPRGKIE